MLEHSSSFSVSSLTGYFLAFGSIAMAWVAKLMFGTWFHNHSPLLPLILAVLITALYGGLGPGMAAAIAGLLIGLTLMELPFGSSLVLYLLLCGGILYAVHSSRRYRRSAEGTLSRLSEREVELEKAVTELRSAKEQAEAANDAKDRFLAALSHELRTPLTPVLLLAESLENRDDLPAAARRDATMIRRHVSLEARLIDDLIDLTRIEKGKLHLERSLANLHDILSAVVEMMLTEANLKKISLTTDLRATCPFIDVDRSRMKQVVLNLIGNAIKFTPAGGRVSVSTENDGNRILIKVRDNGIGIAPEMLTTIFNAFEQAADTGLRRFGGLGLGLAITQSLVTLHGGKVAAQSDGHGKGATFTVTLPVREEEAQPAKICAAPESTATEAKAPGQSRLRILLVEDHEPTAFVLARLLKRRGHDVTMTVNLEEAKACDRHPIDLLVSDIGLPDGTGRDVVRHYRDIQHDGFKAIALSGFGMDNDVERSIAAGFDRHVTKPVDFETLQEVIETLFRENEQKKTA